MKESATAIVATSWSGPLPAPESLQAYENCVKGAVERILAMAEREASVRHELLLKDAKDTNARLRRGQYLGAAVALLFWLFRSSAPTLEQQLLPWRW